MSSSRPTPLVVAERARNEPDGPAIVYLDDDRTVTWSELDEHSRIWSAALRRQGVEAGDFVVTMLPNCPDAHLAWLGICWLRAGEVPVNPDYRGDWLVHAINTPASPILVISHEFAPHILAVADRLEHVQKVVVFDDRPGWDERELARRFDVVGAADFFRDLQALPIDELDPPRPWDIQAVIYTSGTTGRAKPVLLPWGQQEILDMAFTASEFDKGVFYSFYPSFHILGKAMLMLPAKLGGHLVLRGKMSLEMYWPDIIENGCTNTFVISVIGSFLYSVPEQPTDADNPLRAVVMAPVMPEVDDFKRRFGLQVYTFFGSTEIGGCLYSLPREVTGANAASCGVALEESPLEVTIVDEHDYPVPDNTPGELLVRPRVPWVMNQGYLNMPEESVRAWRNGWYHTGDTFIRDENGEHYFQDRVKDYIRRRGENISSFEVEAAVNSLDGVAQSAAVAVEADQAEDEVMIFVVPDGTKDLDPAQVLVDLEGRMPKFAWPRYVEILSALPSTQATFRVQKHKLREEGVGPNTYDRLAPA